jgi:hypothetical protein
VNPKKIKSGPGKQWMEGKDFRLAKEIKYIQRQAAEQDGRFVTIGPLVFHVCGNHIRRPNRCRWSQEVASCSHILLIVARCGLES